MNTNVRDGLNQGLLARVGLALLAAVACTAPSLPTPISSAARLSTAVPAAPTAREVPFDPLPGRPFAGGNGAPRAALIVVSDDLERELAVRYRVATHIADPGTTKALAALDLTKDVAIAAFAGETSTLGFGYTIDRLTAPPDGPIVVTSVLTRPPGDTFLQLVGHPYAVVAVARTQLELARGSILELRDPDGTSRVRLRWCGVLREGRLDWDRAARDCVVAAYAAGESAQLIVQRPTDEGAPIVWSVRAVPGGLSEVAADMSRDPLRDKGRDPVASWACARLDATQQLTGRYALTFSSCTGDGTDVSVP